MEKSMNHVAYETILDRIINCVYPPGSVLTEEQLVELTGASRTPVREAVQKIQMQGLVKVMPKKGIWVSEITEDGIREIYEIRKIIEPSIIRLHGNAIDADRLRALLDRIANRPEGVTDYAEDFEVDDELHAMLILASGNAKLISMCDQIFNHIHRLKVFVGLTAQQNVPRSREEHAEIIERILEGDFEKASHSMLSHLSNSESATYEALRDRKNLLGQLVFNISDVVGG